MIATLTERRKADRAKMAGHIAELARQYGIGNLTTAEQHGSRQVSVDLAGPHGLKTTIQFRGNSPHSQPDTYVLSWHGVEDGWQLSPDTFGHVNPCHGHKATDVIRGFRPLLAALRWRFEDITDGSAFIPGEVTPS